MASLRKQDSPSITPQRKHRKLLKDGSGTEVWPESIEKVFVQGPSLLLSPRFPPHLPLRST